MAESEQVRPLAPAANRYLRDGHDEDTISSGRATPVPIKRLRRRRFIVKCCGCMTALILLLAVTIIVLAFTVFKVKDPEITLNGFNITKIELINNNTVPKPGTNISLTADVSLKNPNVVSFRYTNTTTTLYYHGTVVGEVRGPPGRAKARRTVRMDVDVDLITDNLMSSSNFTAEVVSGILTLNSYSRVPGKVKILKIYKKHVVVKMNCTVSANITARAIQDLNCKKKVQL
ncbi:uncharacterized protein LOC129289780 [Prosopis cineraria]|uniref:uncharacterized protein LOC129289780 n=1 Tax=Prosopis cineraria TaxID=364024 RepID=UPI00240F7200|nr:uncharacterized protein LOC129289780 [Prosopis cineraria]